MMEWWYLYYILMQDEEPTKSKPKTLEDLKWENQQLENDLFALRILLVGIIIMIALSFLYTYQKPIMKWIMSL